jgi:integrase
VAVAVHIRRRQTASGTRYQVRYRRGGRGFRIEHAGTFPSKKAAEIRRDLVAGWLAAGKDPRGELAKLTATPSAPRTFRLAAAAYEWSRIDLAPKSLRSTQAHVRALNDLVGDRMLETLTVDVLQADVVAPLAGRMKANSVSRYMITLRLILDHAGVEPNPARIVRLPRREQVEKRIPTGRQIAAMLSALTPRWALPVRILIATGARVGELERWTWGDVDFSSGRILNRTGKTAKARRWVAVPAEILDDLATTVPLEDRTADRRIFLGYTAAAVRAAIERACRNAGVARITPHDLRHRYLREQLARGVPVAEVGAQVGHARLSMTHDVYTHVVVEEPDA